MNDAISRQLPLMDAGVLNRNVERPLQQKKVAAVIETDKSRGQNGPHAARDEKADVKDKLSEKVEQLNMQLQDMQRGLHFSVDDSSGRIVVKVIDLGTDKVIRQIPSEEMLSLISNPGTGENFIIDDEA